MSLTATSARPGDYRESNNIAQGSAPWGKELKERLLNVERKCAITVPKPGEELASLLS